jgi:hypothetical protein
VTPIVSWAYLVTGGFSGSDRPALLHRMAHAFDRLAARLPRLFAVRLLVVLERQ